jgi:hypothetical protein
VQPLYARNPLSAFSAACWRWKTASSSNRGEVAASVSAARRSLTLSPAVPRAGTRHLLYPQWHASPTFVAKTVNCGAVGSEANKGRIYETWNSTAGFKLNAFANHARVSAINSGSNAIERHPFPRYCGGQRRGNSGAVLEARPRPHRDVRCCPSSPQSPIRQPASQPFRRRVIGHNHHNVVIAVRT